MSSLRWIERKEGQYVAIEGEYRLLIAPHGLVFLVTIFRSLPPDGQKWPNWKLEASSPAATLDDAKRCAAEQLDLLQDLDCLQAVGGL